MSETATELEQQAERVITERALACLARREFSAYELVFRLSRDYDAECVKRVVQQLAEQGMQSDQRYAEAVVRARSRRSQGPIKIEAELQQKGVSDAVVTQAIKTAEVDWFQLATDTYRRRFSEASIQSPADRAKRIRFLLNKGFSMDHIQHALTQEN